PPELSSRRNRRATRRIQRAHRRLNGCPQINVAALAFFPRFTIIEVGTFLPRSTVRITYCLDPIDDPGLAVLMAVCMSAPCGKPEASRAFPPDSRDQGRFAYTDACGGCRFFFLPCPTP